MPPQRGEKANALRARFFRNSKYKTAILEKNHFNMICVAGDVSPEYRKILIFEAQMGAFVHAPSSL